MPSSCIIRRSRDYQLRCIIRKPLEPISTSLPRRPARFATLRHGLLFHAYYFTQLPEQDARMIRCELSSYAKSGWISTAGRVPRHFSSRCQRCTFHALNAKCLVAISVIDFMTHWYRDWFIDTAVRQCYLLMRFIAEYRVWRYWCSKTKRLPQRLQYFIIDALNCLRRADFPEVLYRRFCHNFLRD